MRKSITGDRVAGGIFIVLGIISFIEGLRLRPLRARGMPGDDAFPTLLGLVMIGLGSLLAFKASRQERLVSWPERQQAVSILASGAILAGYWLILPYLGFPISTFIATAGLFYYIGHYRWHVNLLLSAIVTAPFHALFVMWLGMPFPEGVFGI
jgi:putative tricarboxylic transport membrane protein